MPPPEPLSYPEPPTPEPGGNVNQTSAVLSIPKRTDIRLHGEVNMCQSLFTPPDPEKWLFSPAQFSQNQSLISNMETNWWGADLLS